MCPGPPKSWVACKELTTALGQVWGHLTSGLDLGGLLPVHPCLLPSCQVEQACSPRSNPPPQPGRWVVGQQLTRATPNLHLMLISCRGWNSWLAFGSFWKCLVS